VRSRIIIFTRYPEPGKVKTRLVPALGEPGACDLHRRMAERTLKTARQLDPPGLRIQVRYDGGGPELMKSWLGADVGLFSQGEGDLGERMGRAFENAFSDGIQKALIIGTDSPSITPQLLRLALFHLETSDVVLGPAADGGYYLIGMGKQAAPQALPGLMNGIPWGTGEVLRRTLEKAHELGLKVSRTEMLGDIDRPEDLGLWQEAIRSEDSETISVIVPAINEENNIVILAENLACEQKIEIIVADGGSSDGTAVVAGILASKVVISKRGRWVQMNTGAEAASGEVLLFLHADTRLPPGFSGYIRQALDDPDAVAGAFRFATDLDTVSMKLIEWAANMRASRLGIIYSDQALFIRSCLFRELGGFPDQPIMEDYEFTRRVRARGKTVLLPYKAVSSARRWETVGTWKLTVIHYIITGAYLLGVSSERVAGWYGRLIRKEERGKREEEKGRRKEGGARRGGDG